MNLKVYITINAIIYFFKFIYKNNDCITVTLKNSINKNKYYLSNYFIRSIKVI